MEGGGLDIERPKLRGEVREGGDDAVKRRREFEETLESKVTLIGDLRRRGFIRTRCRLMLWLR